MDFLQILSSQGDKYILVVMICIVYTWVEAFPCRRAMALSVGKQLLENPRDGEAWWAAIYGGHTDSDMTEVT